MTKTGDVKSDGLSKVVGVKPAYSGFLFMKKGYDLMDETLDKWFNKIPTQLDAPSSFMEIFLNMTDDLCSNNLKM